MLSQLIDKYLKPIAYFSKHLSKQERNYSTTEKELFAIVLAIEHFRQFLYGIHFTVVTDHQPLKYLLKIANPEPRLVRWIIRLSMFKFHIEYRKGCKNGNADAMSRLPVEADEDEDKQVDEPIVIYLTIEELTDPKEDLNTTTNENQENLNKLDLNEEQKSDEDLKWFYDLKLKAISENKNQIVVKEFKNKNQKSYYAQWNRFNIIGNTIFRSWCDKNQTILQCVLPKNRIQEVLKESHDPPHSGHLGKNKTGD